MRARSALAPSAASRRPCCPCVVRDDESRVVWDGVRVHRDGAHGGVGQPVDGGLVFVYCHGRKSASVNDFAGEIGALARCNNRIDTRKLGIVTAHGWTREDFSVPSCTSDDEPTLIFQLPTNRESRDTPRQMSSE